MKYFKMTVMILAFFIFVLMPGLLFADSPAPNMPQKVYSSDKQFYIEMTPKDGWGGYGPGEGIVYKVKGDGKTEKLWSVDFYSGEAILTNDGKHLVAFGPWASSMSDLAIAFYAEGKELKKYSVKDLIPDESKLQHSVSHFFWQSFDKKKARGLQKDGKEFILPLIDGRVIVFDMTTGEILKK